MIKHIRIRKPGEFIFHYEGTEFSVKLTPGKKEGTISIHKTACQTEVVLIGHAQGLGFFVSWIERGSKLEYAFHLSREYAIEHAGKNGQIFEPSEIVNNWLLNEIKDCIIRPPTTT
jgi:hypothetical protein